MKIKIKKDLLLENLNKVSKAISTKNLVPALAGIKFDLTNEGLTLTASDNDITIRSFIKNDDNMSIEEEGSIIIQGRYILDIVRKLPDNMINLEVFDEMKVIISTENSEYNLNGINKSEYPNINLEENKTPIIINSKEFKELINQNIIHTKGYIFDSLVYRFKDYQSRAFQAEVIDYKYTHSCSDLDAREKIKDRHNRDLMRFIQILDEAIGEHD